jgi:type 1 glutamine amidotransferase
MLTCSDSRRFLRRIAIPARIRENAPRDASAEAAMTKRRRPVARPVRPGAAHHRRLALERLEPRDLLAAFDVLVFSKTASFRHSSIDEGVAAIAALGAANDFTVTATENAAAFNAANLASFEAVVFLCTTGDILNATQQTAFEQYIQAGGGWVGVHSAADTEFGWAWYGELVGAYFQNHPAIQQATIVVEDHVHPSTAHLPDTWVRTDEWYNYQTNPRASVHVLATLDESTYSGGADGADHPIAWYHDYSGGRAWYTGLGHTEATYAEPLFRQHLLGGILYAAGQATTADFDGSGSINGNDFLQWQRGVGISSGARTNDGDANWDGRVDGSDLSAWQIAFADAAESSGSASAAARAAAVDRAIAEPSDEPVTRRTLDDALPMIVDEAPASRPKRMLWRRVAFAGSA